ncbi:siderophore-interacting protein [Musicola keenii]|uniref:siderophore-interacting protein n=1 Tax=Musicola keenii TaxID=2884250 RepID=UPI00177DD741|nr:siderophore-interacting protein [Musicola keenii]
MSGVQGYKVFDITLMRKEMLTPSLMCCVFGGEAVREMKMGAPDQRIKLLFPSEDGTPSRLPTEGEWYRLAQQLPKAQRPIPRTYTMRRLDTEKGEMEVEFVIHGTEGPASSWAMTAQPGAEVQAVAPNGAFPDDCGGYEWVLPPRVTQVMLAADETALPAVKGILEQLAERAEPPRVQAFIEVPLAADCVDLSQFAFAEVFWLPREDTGASYGERLLAAVRQSAQLPEAVSPSGLDVQEIPDDEVLWERAQVQQGEFFGWIAAESSSVKNLRRYLLGERGIAREAVTFMAYWSRGARSH